MSTAVITSTPAGAGESTLVGRPRYVVTGTAAVRTGKVAVAKRATRAEVEALRRRVREHGR